MCEAAEMEDICVKVSLPTSSFFINEVIKGVGVGKETKRMRREERGSGLKRKTGSAASRGALEGGRNATAFRD